MKDADVSSVAARATAGTVMPQDCALVIGIPLTLEEFTCDWTRHDLEFVPSIIKEKYNTSDVGEAWNGKSLDSLGYSQFCAQIRDEIDQVREAGVTVVESARIDSLRPLFENFKVVSFIAHGPFPLIDVEDVSSPAIFLDAFECVREKNNPQTPALLKWLLKFAAIRNADSLVMMIGGLRPLLERSRHYYQREIPIKGDQPEQREDLPRAYELDNMMAEVSRLTRMILAEAIPNSLESPPIIELRDGFHSFDKFVSTIPESFTGTVDFGVCSAQWFAEHIRRVRPLCKDILCSKQLAFIGTRTKIYKHIINQLQFSPSSFSHAYELIHQAILMIIRSELGSTQTEMTSNPLPESKHDG